MGESYQYNNQNHNQHIQHQNNQQASGSSSRLGLRTTGGEIVEVQGGHIVRSTGRKDRHSKVCTAKGPRDRRVRLSAHTAIQFYDVQDRLGYDRPSKAVDWLIKKAKAAIDELAELPAWKPTASTTTAAAAAGATTSRNPNSTSISDFEHNPDELNQLNQMGGSQNSSFLPPSLDSDSIADTIKSFFPMGASANNNNYQSFPPSDLVTRPGGQTQNHQSQDLRLSLQSFQHPILHNHQNHQTEQADNNSIYFDGSGWPDRMVTWGGDGGVSAGFVFGSQSSASQTTPFLQPLSNGQMFNSNNSSSQRGPLQSSTAPSFRAWIDAPPPYAASVAVDQHPNSLVFHHPNSVPGFASGFGGFSGFRVPARIQGEAEEHDGISDRPSSASSDSHH